jgi:hypothetical protein
MTDPRKLRRTLRSRTNFAEAKKTNDEISPFYRIWIGNDVSNTITGPRRG